MGISDKNFYKDNEIAYIKAKGWLVAGTVDAAKWKLSDDAVSIEFERFVESLPAKEQLLVRMMVAGNAEKSSSEVKAYLQ